MLTNRSAPHAFVVPVLTVTNVRAAVDWYADVFGFVEHVQIGDGHRAQLGDGDVPEVHPGGVISRRPSGSPPSSPPSSSPPGGESTVPHAHANPMAKQQSCAIGVARRFRLLAWWRDRGWVWRFEHRASDAIRLA